MPNESKSNSPIQWDKWGKSGAIGDSETAKLNHLEQAKPIVAIGIDHQKNTTTLSIGEEVVHQGPSWIVTKPELYAVVPGQGGYKLGDMVTRETLPKRTKTVGQVYGKK